MSFIQSSLFIVNLHTVTQHANVLDSLNKKIIIDILSAVLNIENLTDDAIA